MRFFYIIALCFLFIFPSYGFDSFYVYVKNTTPHTLVLPHGGRVLPNAQAIFESFPTHDINGSQYDVEVQGRIYVKGKNEKSCHVNFETYANFDTFVRDQHGQHGQPGQCYTKRFATFIIVSENGHHLICNPVAAQISPHGSSMMPNGEQLTIKKAKKARKKFEKQQEKMRQQLQEYHNQNAPGRYEFNDSLGTYRFNPLSGKHEFIPFKKE